MPVAIIYELNKHILSEERMNQTEAGTFYILFPKYKVLIFLPDVLHIQWFKKKSLKLEKKNMKFCIGPMCSFQA